MRTNRTTVIVVETTKTTPEEHERIVREVLAQDYDLHKRFLANNGEGSTVSIVCAPGAQS